METKLNRLIAALALLALSTLNAQLSTALAQGTAFTYQGRLFDTGQAANGSYDLTFTLFDAPTDGNQVGDTITNLGVGVSSNGLFTLALDFGGQFDGTPLWLEIGVETNGAGGSFTVLSGRQPLTPTPYAIFSENIAANAIATANLQDSAITGAKINVPLMLNGYIPSGSTIVGNNSAVSGTGVAANGDTAVAGYGATMGVYGYSGSGTGVYGSGYGYGVHGVSSTPLSGYSGVFGEYTGNGIGYGVYGNGGVGGTGVYGFGGLGGTGVYGSGGSYSGYFNGLLHVTGNAEKTAGGTSWVVASDRRLKQDVKPYEPGLNEVMKLRPVRFRYRDDADIGLGPNHEEVGFIAQEVRDAIPEAVIQGNDGYLRLTVDPIHWAAINAIQELNKKMEVRSRDLEEENAELKARLEKLEQMMADKTGGVK